MNAKDIKEAIEYNKRLDDEMDVVWTALGLNYCLDPASDEMIKKIAAWQQEQGLAPDGKVGPSTFSKMIMEGMTPRDRALYKAFRFVQMYESRGRYDLLNLDGEFRGHFDKVYIKRTGKKHPLSGVSHVGLSAFAIQWTQDGGSLGKLLKRMHEKNPEKFQRIVGMTWDALLMITNEPGPSGASRKVLRGPRVKPVPVVDNLVLRHVDLWEKPWIAIFKELGQDLEFQQVQREVAIEQYLAPFYGFMKSNGLKSEKAVAIIFNRSVHYGTGKVKSLFPASALKKGEKAALENAARRYHRASDILKDSRVGNSEWEGFSFI